jgi:hypothetical protein
LLSRIKRKQNTEVKSNKMEETLLDIIVEAHPDEEILKADGLSHEEALDAFYYNTHSAYVGEKTPIWCNDFTY